VGRVHPQVFVGCATQDLAVAEAVQQKLEYDAEVEIWNEGTFVPSIAALNSLMAKTKSVDFAVLIATGTDKLTRTITQQTGIERSVEVDEILPIPRDNVLFELGLFMGAIGQDRTFLMIDRAITDLKLPTDLSGITHLDFDGTKTNLQSAVGSACTTIKNRIQELGRRTDG
jgi:predicted nucleotide-binding protein